MSKEYDELDSMQMDALREIGNIGTGNAVTSLSAMLTKTVNIQVPRISFLDYNEAVEKMGGPETTMVGILLTLHQDVNGIMMFLLETDFAKHALSTLLGLSADEVDLTDEMGKSVVQELGNIMAGSYVNAIAQLTGLTIDISVPSLCTDMVGAILSVPAIYFADISDQIMFIENQFQYDNDTVRSHILLMPDWESLAKILEKLGMTNG